MSCGPEAAFYQFFQASRVGFQRRFTPFVEVSMGKGFPVNVSAQNAAALPQPMTRVPKAPVIPVGHEVNGGRGPSGDNRIERNRVSIKQSTAKNMAEGNGNV